MSVWPRSLNSILIHMKGRVGGLFVCRDGDEMDVCTICALEVCCGLVVWVGLSGLVCGLMVMAPR